VKESRLRRWGLLACVLGGTADQDSLAVVLSRVEFLRIEGMLQLSRVEVAVQLQDKVALITGANSGIGKAIALRYGQAGANVAINYVTDPEAAEEVRRHVEDMGRCAITVKADISQVGQVRDMVGQTIDAFSRIDILVNNAGLQIEKAFPELTPEDWDKMTRVDLRGTFLVTLHAVQEMIKRKHGKIINVTSVHQEIPKPYFAPYCAAKAGVGMLTKVLAVELAPYKISINNLAPGAIETPINIDVLRDPEKLKRVLGQIPWGRMGQPEEVAEMAVYLASDAAEYVTGATFVIDGGLTQQVVQY